MIVLLSINVGMVVVTGIASRYFGRELFMNHLGLKASAVVGHLELWQPFTYFWVHSLTDPGHLIWNLLTLWLFSSALERHWGTARFVTNYLIFGFGSGLVVLSAGLLWPPDPDIPTVGASGAILGLVAAFGVLFPRLPVYLFGLFPIKGRTLAIGFAIISTAVPLVYGHASVSLGAHIGGLALGALVASGFWRPDRLWRRVRLARARRRLKVLEGGRGQPEGYGEGDGPGRYLH